ncbi:hypothetical protein CVD28_24510 [Bacillus sp. M6-12]|uniref:hypothetical protein n=1 Tax=Bacillus sp. M6-12 TaxID=2054166 RepID=UPI000C78567F|nr:hypothetical protein [Bacillus sp. M6-12]PLS15046.1 hypothetical protein CVD28_24510 [Bacillus sp. M6-12]
MNLMTKEQIKELVLQVEGFEIQEETNKGIEVYDNEEDKFFRYRYLEELNIEEVFQFNSLQFNKDAFFRIFKECVDLNMLMIVDKVVFLNNEEEYDQLIEEYPDQSMDMDRAVGINFYMDNVVVVNVKLIRSLAEELALKDELSDVKEELAMGIWQTLVHELRHNITANPIILEDMISIEEGEEDKVEEYCRNVFEESIEKHPEYCCFK